MTLQFAIEPHSTGVDWNIIREAKMERLQELEEEIERLKRDRDGFQKTAEYYVRMAGRHEVRFKALLHDAAIDREKRRKLERDRLWNTAEHCAQMILPAQGAHLLMENSFVSALHERDAANDFSVEISGVDFEVTAAEAIQLAGELLQAAADKRRAE